MVASGVQYRRLPLERLADFEGLGVYYSATEMEARYCKDTEAVIIGGGNSAGQAAMFLCRYAPCVRVLVRGASLADSMSSYLTSRLEADPGIAIEYNCEVTALEGGEHLESVTIRNATSGQSRKVATRALFIMVGAAPNTEWLSGLVNLDDKGFVITGVGSPPSPFATSYPGVFAVGDVRKNASAFTGRDVASSPQQHTGHGAAMPHNTSIEYFPAPVTYNSKKPPIMLRFL